eukprot:664192-Amorphochlora_amoeboformis.AAC.1
MCTYRQASLRCQGCELKVVKAPILLAEPAACEYSPVLKSSYTLLLPGGNAPKNADGKAGQQEMCHLLKAAGIAPLACGSSQTNTALDDD